MSKRIHLEPTVTIPDHWSADEALVVASFLSRISRAIWAAHGHQMAKELCRADELSQGAPIPLPRSEELDQDDDDMPF